MCAIVATICFAGMRDDQREALQGQLVDIIVRVLIKNEQLHYYQVSTAGHPPEGQS